MPHDEEELLRLARLGNPENLKKFLAGSKGQKAVEVNCSSRDGATPLIQCVQGAGRGGRGPSASPRRPGEAGRHTDHLACCRHLLAHNTNPDSRDNLGRTALHWAVFYKKVDFVETLLSHRANPSLRDDRGQNVVHFAVRVNADECLQLLCRRVPAEVLELQDVEGTPLLVYATQLGHTNAVKILLGSGTQTGTCNREKQTAAHIAAWGERTDILKLLLGYGAKSYLADINRITVIAAASACHNPEVLRLILEEGKIEPKFLDIADVDGRTPLIIASQKGHTKVMEMLIDFGASLDITDKSGKTAVHHAIEHHHNDCVKMLLEADPSLAALTDTEGRNALHLATIEGDIELIQLVLPHVDINALDNEHHSAIHWATVCGLYNCISLLIESGCTPATPDAHGAYPMHYATQMCGDPSTAAVGLRCLQALLRKGGSSVNCVDEGGKTPLLWAASAGNVRACRLLVDLNADTTMADENGLTAVHCATCRNHPACLESLLRDSRCDPNPADKKGCTPLFYAITMGHSECARTLLKYGASPSWQDHSGKSPAFCAASRGSVPFLSLLHDYKASLHLRTATKDAPLTEAAKAGHTDAVTFLLEHGCSARTRDGTGRTSLHHAASKNNLSLCRRLVHHEANINSVYQAKQKPWTPLDCAEEKASTECVNYLLSLGAKHGADIPKDLWQSGDEEDDKDTRKGDASREMDKDEKQNVLGGKTDDAGGTNPEDKVNVSSEDTGGKVTIERLSRNGDSKVDTAELERKLTNWNTYLQDNVEFLDVVINSKAPELSEARRQARSQKKELVGRLEELKTELERSCQLLVEDVERKEEDRKERSVADLAVVRRLHDIEERFQRANASAAASLDEFYASQHRSVGERDSHDHPDSDEDSLLADSSKNTYDSRRQRHEAWMERRNREYINKKKSLRVTPHSSAGTSKDRSRTLVLPTRRSHAIPDHRTVKSPYNAKVILPLRLPEPRQRRSNESQLSGHEEAEIRRRMGELNNAMLYPKASQMRIQQWQGLYDMKGPCTPRWDGGERPRYALRFVTPEEFSRQLSWQK